jgi:hypothetical protein
MIFTPNIKQPAQAMSLVDLEPFTFRPCFSAS